MSGLISVANSPSSLLAMSNTQAANTIMSPALNVANLLTYAGGVEVFDYSFANEFFGKTVLTIPIEYAGRLLWSSI